MSIYNPLGLCKFIVKGKVEPQHVAASFNLALADWRTGGERDAVKGVLGIPEDHTIVAQTPVGVPDQAAQAKPNPNRTTTPRSNCRAVRVMIGFSR